MSADATPPTGEDRSERHFDYEELRPWLDALHDPLPEVRAGVLRTLEYLPLSPEVQAEIEGLHASILEGDDELLDVLSLAPLEAFEEPGLPEGTTRRAPDPELSRQASQIAADWMSRARAGEPPFDTWEDLPWAEADSLAYLPPDQAAELVSVLFANLVAQLPPGERLDAGNDLMLLLPSELWRSFEPDIPALYSSYLALDQEEDEEVRWQLTWVMARAGLRPLMAELARRLEAADEAERVAIVGLLEEAITALESPHLPTFGGGPPAGHELGRPRSPFEGTLGVPDEPEPEAPFELEGWEELAGWEGFERDEDFALSPEPEPEPTPAPAPIPEARWLQGQLFEMKDGEQTQLARALRAGARHRLVVRIGVPHEDWITAPRDAPVPVEELPADHDEYELRIVFSEPNHVPEPLTGAIYLPRLRGNSTTCEFQFRARADAPAFEGRVVVMYGSRILQTMLLVARVLPDPAQAPSEMTIEFKPETSVRANLQDLESRSPVDVALVADTGADGTTHVTEIAGERVALRSMENIEAPIKRLRRKITQIANAPDDFSQGLDATATVNLLRYLARHGSYLYDGIVVSQLGHHPLRTARRIQLVSARESFLPLEFVYERPSPTGEATLCPNAREALETGECPHCDQLDAETAKAYICPMGFWCMSRVIERHAVKPVSETNLSGAEFALGNDPITGRDILDVLNTAVYATSHRVKEEQIQELESAMGEVFGPQVEHVEDWDAWRTAVQNNKPSILVLVLHTTKDEDDIPTLEIGDEQLLPGDQITDTHVHAAPDDQPPVVLLLGCETAVPEVPFQSFALQFRIHGAAIVLSTLTPVLGRHAVPVAVILLDELRRIARASGTFGEALLGLRRRALAAGIPMVLSLISYGDADWRLEGGNDV